MRIVLHHDYPVPAREVWEHVTLWPNLMRISLDAIDYAGLPQGRMRTGQRVTYAVSGGFPLHEFEWRAHLLEVDDRRMRMRTDERGGPIRIYRHDLSVEETARGCRMHDRLEVLAGLMTLPAWYNIRRMLRRRHERRERLLTGGDAHALAEPAA